MTPALTSTHYGLMHFGPIFPVSPPLYFNAHFKTKLLIVNIR